MSKHAQDMVTAKPAGMHRLDMFFDGRLIDRLLLPLFGGGAAAGAAADAGLIEAGTAIGGTALGGSAAGAAAEAAASAAGRAAAGAATHGSGLFSSVFDIASAASDILVDNLIYSNWRTHHGSDSPLEGEWYDPFNPTEADAARAKEAGKRTFTREEIEAMGPIGETLHDYGFLRQQLRLHADKSDALRALSEAFDAKGMELPSEEEIKDAYKKLAQVVHPDANPGKEKVAEELFKRLSRARKTLGDAERRATYEALQKQLEDPALADTKTLIGDMLTHCSTVDWGDFYCQAMRQEPAGLLSGPKEEHQAAAPAPAATRPGFTTRLIEDMETASRMRQGGMVFGGVSGVGLATYCGAKSWEAMHDKESGHPHHLRDAALYGTTALGGCCLSLAALNGLRLQGGAVR